MAKRDIIYGLRGIENVCVHWGREEGGGGFPGQCVGKIQTITRGFDGSQKEHVVLVKSNGFPTYILVVTVTRITDGKTQLYPTPTEGEHHGEED